MTTPYPVILADTASSWMQYLQLKLSARLQTLQRLPTSDEVLMLAWQFPPDVSGGVYRPLSIANYFARSSQPITVVSRAVNDRTVSAGEALLKRLDPRVKVHRLTKVRQKQPSFRGFPRVDSSLPSAMQLAHESIRLYGKTKPRLVVATGPPFHDFVAGYWLARIWDVPLVIDYRDEWTQCPFDFVQLGSRDEIWERRVNDGAAAIIFVSHSQMEHHLSVFGSGLTSKSMVIPNGWEPTAIGEPASTAIAKGNARTITFAGKLGSHTPVDGFLELFSQQLVQRRKTGQPELKLQFLGGRDAPARQALARFPFQDSLIVRDQMPQQDAISAMRASDILLIVNTSSLARYIPGKLYDYLASGTPVLSYGKGGEVERILALTQSGIAVAENDSIALTDAIERLLTQKTVPNNTSTIWLTQHTRDAAAQRLLALVSRLTHRS